MRKPLIKLFSLFALSLLLLAPGARAQAVAIDTLNKYGLYDADRLSPAFHADRRRVLLDYMASGSIAVFVSAPKRNRANDVDYLYHQDPNFYYLTGLEEDNSALILIYPEVRLPDGVNAGGSTTHALLFVQRRDPTQETWTGKRLGIEGASKVLGFTHVYPIDSLSAVVSELLTMFPSRLSGSTRILYYNLPYDAGVSDKVLDHRVAVADEMDSVLGVRFPDVRRMSLKPQLAAMRMVKQPEELALMKRAIAITNEAHNEIMRQVKPGWHEYEIQALGEYIFGKNGAEYPGYPCIVGSGENSVILHYNTNRRKTEPGDVVEMDIGAEYHGYTADVTRSYPVNGKFTKEQRILYDLVLEAQDSGIAKCQVGNAFKSTHQAAVSVIGKGLVRLGIIKSEADYRKYFMHGTSHYLGLDVHDAGTGGPLLANTIITVEPGIYIKEGSDCDPKWWNIGLRIEDDILITNEGPVNLSSASPRTADAVEALMRERKASR